MLSEPKSYNVVFFFIVCIFLLSWFISFLDQFFDLGTFYKAGVILQWICSNTFVFFVFLYFGFQYICFYIVSILYWVLVCIPHIFIFNQAAALFLIDMFLIGFEAVLLLLSILFFICGRLAFVVMDCSLDLLRILASLSFSHDMFPVGLHQYKGWQLSPLFFFQPDVSLKLTGANYFFGFVLCAEVIIVQIIYIFFQIVWLWVFFSCYIFNFSLSSILNVPFGIVWVVSNVGNFFWFIFVCCAGLCLVLMLVQYKLSYLLNFFGFYSLFRFVMSDRWFGLNLAPTFRVFSVFLAMLKTRRIFASTAFWRLEGWILFTTHLRVDPKVMELPYWLYTYIYTYIYIYIYNRRLLFYLIFFFDDL